MMRHRNRTRTGARAPRNPALLGIALVALACWSVPEVDRREIRPWLVCSDCTSDELNRVLAIGPRAERYLRAAIVDGPTPADDSVITLQATEGVLRARRYRGLQHAADTVTSTDSSRIVRHQLSDFRLRYRLRAAEALVRIDPRLDSAAVRTFCTNAPPELLDRPAYKSQFRQYGECP